MIYAENLLQKQLVAWFRNLSRDGKAMQFGKIYELNTPAMVVSNVNEISIDTGILKFIPAAKLKAAKEYLQVQRISKISRAKASGRKDGEADLEIKFLHPVYKIYTFIYIELKSFDNYSKHSDLGLNDNEKLFQIECQQKGIPYYVCCTPQMFIDILLENNIIKEK